MHRFYIAPENWHPDAPLLTGSEAHHCRNVLRLESGDKVVLFDGRGHEVTAEITGSDPAQIQLRKMHEARTPPLRCRITLGQAIPKGKNMDLIVQKAVEIGAAEIAPILSDRTIVRLDEESAASKQEKWQTVAIEAAKQCGQNWLPQVQLGAVEEVLADEQRVRVLLLDRASDALGVRAKDRPQHRRFDLQLIGSLQTDAVHLKKILAEYSAEHDDRPANVLMLVGPEGDFTPAELSLARSQGCRPITLGPIVLRVETASIYCLSVLSYELLV